MKKIIVFTLGAVILALAYFLLPIRDSRQAYEAYLRSHPYMLELKKGKAKSKGTEETDRPDLAFMQDYLRTMDPALKRPVPEQLFEQNVVTARLRDGRGFASARTQATTLAEATEWIERGPHAVGGRTRAMLFDPADPQAKKVWAGGVSGGLWVIEDITNASANWTKVDDFWDNLSISCIAADPNNNQIMYVGTGEAHTGMRGGGIWKTSNGGASWAPLNSTSTFLHIRDIAVRNESGTSVVYAAVNRHFDLDSPPANEGLYRSANGGTSWTQVLPDVEFGFPFSPTDIEIGDDKIWVGAKPTYSDVETGSIIYSSTTGSSGWEVTQFPSIPTKGQIELAIAPSDSDVIYAILEEGNAVEAIVRTTDGGDTWSLLNEPEDADTGIPADDFTRGQAWYDLTLAVHPTNPNIVITGGIDLFRTADGGTNWTQISEWHAGIPGTFSVVHADQHEILYRPGFPDQAIFGNDGGVYYATNLNGTPNISVRNNNYNVTQFYTAALHPTTDDYMLGGTQDNGTQKFTQSGFGATSEAFGGDGALCFIDQLTPNIQIVSYVYNNIYLSINGGASFNPGTPLLEDNSSGNFINVGEYDPNLKILYTAKSDIDIYRITGIGGTKNIGTVSVPDLGSMATAMRLSPFVTNASNLYVGTEAGRVFRIENAHTGSGTRTEITGPDFSNGSISGIAFGANEDQMLVTFFNYGVVSVWETRNGGATWIDREGNLPNMPVRWVEYHPHNPDQAYLATELGVWSTDNINVADPVWTPTNGGLANVRTDMLRIRTSDGIMMASTHGRGVFTALIPAQLEQEITFNALSAKTFGDAPFEIQATSTSELEVTFESSNPSVASVAGNIVTIHAAGTVSITAMQEGNVYYSAATPVEQSLTINKAAQTITFNALPEKEITDDPFDLIATSSSALPVTFTSSDGTVATVSGTEVTIHGVGTTTITAKQPGSTNYLPAADVQRQLTVVSRIIVLTGDLDFGEVIFGESATRDLTISNAGTANITIEGITYPEGFSGVVSVGATEIIVAVTFTPTGLEVFEGEVQVTSNATSGASSIAVSGTGIAITDVEKYMDKLLTVYPNPADDWIIVSGVNLKQVETLTITDESGRRFDEPVDSWTEREIKMNVAGFPRGVYLVAIQAGSGVYYKKFSKN